MIVHEWNLNWKNSNFRWLHNSERDRDNNIPRSHPAQRRILDGLGSVQTRKVCRLRRQIHDNPSQSVHSEDHRLWDQISCVGVEEPFVAETDRGLSIPFEISLHKKLLSRQVFWANYVRKNNNNLNLAQWDPSRFIKLQGKIFNEIQNKIKIFEFLT